MKYDCSKTIEFIHENNRLCAYYFENDNPSERCGKCPLFKFDCGEPDAMDDEYIRTVQKWSDEHPEETIFYKFIKNYPDAPLALDGTPEGLCPHRLGYKDIGCDNCFKCWNRTREEATK